MISEITRGTFKNASTYFTGTYVYKKCVKPGTGILSASERSHC